MKTKLIQLLCYASFFMPSIGCQMLQDRFSDPANIAFVAGLARNAAQIGVATDLKAHPEHRTAFEVAVGALDALVDRGEFSETDLSAVLAGISLDGGGLQGDDGALLLGQIGTVVVLDIATLFGFDINSAPALKAVATGIRDGLKAGLAAPVAKARAIESPSDVPGKALVPVRVKRI